MNYSARRHAAPCTRRFSILATVALAATAAHGIEIETGDPDWNLRFDNTVKGSVMARLRNADPVLANSFGPTGPQALNFNVGDDNFRKRGLVSERVDLLSEFDAVYQKTFGMRVSTAAWYDAAYHKTTDATDAPGPTGFPNVFTPGNGQTPYNRFAPSTRDLAGQKFEVLDAFVFGGWQVGDNQKLTLRLGRHAVQYGESLFFGDNGIARAQGPIDVMKLQSSPNAQFKEIVRPVPQVSTQFQASSDVSVGAYYQFRWEADRQAPAGSYFNTANNIWGSTLPEFISIPAGPTAGNYVLAPGAEHRPPSSGQYGAQLKLRMGETDVGVYAARYHDKSGQFFSALNFANPADSEWFYVFPKEVSTIGLSATRSVGDINFAFETSLRNNMPLVSQNVVFPLGTPQPTLATGRTAHANLSWIMSLPPNLVSQESSFVGEVAWNSVLKKNDPDDELDKGRTRQATAIQLIFSPSYRQVASGLDLNVPVGLRYALHGRSAVTGQGWGPEGTGSVSLGLDGNYEGVWQFTATYNKFLGRATPFVSYTNFEYNHGNTLADRDFISLSLRRTF